MKDPDINQIGNEARLFEQIKAQIRHEPGHALRLTQIRGRYVYRDRKYSPSEVIDWFMNAPFEDVKVIAEELGIDWKAIAKDVQWMGGVLKQSETEQGVYSEINEPFGPDRDVSRLLFDFSILFSCIKQTGNLRLLDFAGGDGWSAEYLNRAGFDVYAFDIEPLTVDRIKKRVRADPRVDGSRLHAAICDAHNLEIYTDGHFGNIFCFDSLHHMFDFGVVFREMFRVLEPGGRASFAEPGSKHADSQGTKEFMQKHKAHDPNWIEKNIVLKEINETACSVGFQPLRVKPFLLPGAVDYSFDDWKHFARNRKRQKKYISDLISFNTDNRVIFYIDKPQM